MKPSLWHVVIFFAIGIGLAAAGVPTHIALPIGGFIGGVYGLFMFLRERAEAKEREHELEVARLLSKQSEIVPLTRADDNPNP
jgi:hypothetical protein